METEERDPQDLKLYAEWASHQQAVLGRPITVFDAWKDAEEVRQVCAQAYQVVGSLLCDVGQFGSDNAEKILDNLASMRLLHSDVLPWPSFEWSDGDAVGHIDADGRVYIYEGAPKAVLLFTAKGAGDA